MIRKDLAQDGDRQHFYSQYWIDIVLGKPSGQAGTTTEEAPADVEDIVDDVIEDVQPVAAVAPKAEPKPKKAPEKKEQPRTINSLADLANIDLLMRNSAQMEDSAVPDIEAAPTEVEEPAIVTNFDIDSVPVDEEAAAPADELEDFGEEFEEEEDDEWGGSRKPKPRKQQPRRERHTF